MEKELVLPHGVKIADGHLYFGDHQVMHYGTPYKFANPYKMCTSFAIRHNGGRLCTTLDIILAPEGVDDWRYKQGFIWLCAVDTIGGKYIPSAHYDSWNRVEYILTNLVPELQGSGWYICTDDENYVFDEETGMVRKLKTIETVTCEWDD